MPARPRPGCPAVLAMGRGCGTRYALNAARLGGIEAPLRGLGVG